MTRSFFTVLLVVLLLQVACVEPPDPPDNQDLEPLKLVWEIGYNAYVWGAYAPPAVVRDSLLIYSGDGAINCVTADSGKWKWSSTYQWTGFMHKSFVMDQSALFGFSGRDKVFSIYLENGNTRWETEIDSNREFGFYTDINSTQYYLGAVNLSKRKTIYSLNKDDGHISDSLLVAHVSWSLRTHEDRLFSGSRWYPDSPNSVGQIVCYSASSLDTIWLYSFTGGGISSGNIVVTDDNTLYSGTIGGGQLGNEVVALNAETGERLWRTETYGCYQIVLDGDVLYYAGSGSANALNKHTGEVLWRSIINYPDESSPLAYWDGYVYKAHGGTLFVIDAVTGERVYHTYTFKGNSEYVYQVSAGAGKIFVQTSRHLFAFEPFNPEALNTSDGEPASFRNPLALEPDSQ